MNINLRAEKQAEKIEHLELVAKFENCHGRLPVEPALRRAFLALSYGSGIYAVLDDTLKQFALLAEENTRLKRELEATEVMDAL